MRCQKSEDAARSQQLPGQRLHIQLPALRVLASLHKTSLNHQPASPADAPHILRLVQQTPSAVPGPRVRKRKAPLPQDTVVRREGRSAFSAVLRFQLTPEVVSTFSHGPAGTAARSTNRHET